MYHVLKQEVLSLEIETGIAAPLLIDERSEIVAQCHVRDTEIIAILKIEVGELPVDIFICDARYFVRCAFACPAVSSWVRSIRAGKLSSPYFSCWPVK